MKTIMTALVILGLFAGGAQAAILGSYLTFDGSPDYLTDDSVGLFVTQDDGYLQEGDSIIGLYRFNETIPSGTVTENVFAVYSLEVAGLTQDGSHIIVDTRAPTSGSYTMTQILTDSGFYSGGSTGLHSVAGSLDDAVVAIVEKPVPTIQETDMDATGGFINGGAIGGEISDSNGWSLDMVFGFLGDDFHQIRLDDEFSPVVSGKVDLTPLFDGTVPDGGTIASYLGAYSVIEDIFGLTSDQYLEQPINDWLDSTVEDGELITAGSNNIAKSGVVNANNDWIFQDSGDFSINAVPEPASMAIWSMLLMGGILAVCRRRESA